MSNTRKMLGSFGENEAQKYLEDQDYKILEKNFKCSHGEIDIIALQEKELVFIEVRTRSSLSFGEPYESINKVKQKRLIKLAQYYLKYKNIKNCNMRFDVVSVLADKRDFKIKKIELIKNAF